MSLRVKYWLIVILVHMLLVVAVYHLLSDNKWLFLLFEVVVLISFFLCHNLFRSLIRPIELMHLGGNAIRDRDFNTRLLHTGSREVDSLIDVYNTMMQRLGEERGKAEEQNIFLENFIRLAPVGIIILDYDGNVDLINPTAQNILGPEALRSIHFASVFREFSELLNSQDGATQKIVRLSDGKNCRIHTGKIIHKGFLRKYILIEDLTVELLQSEKEAYGKVIRMMAHEVNNSMGAVNSIIQTVIQHGDENGLDEDLNEGLKVALDRNEKLTAFMKNFARVIRISQPHRLPTELGPFLASMARLWQIRCAEAGIGMTVDAGRTVVVDMDVVQMEQVMTNLIKNAVEAIGKNGKIILGILEDRNGWYVADNGCGISEVYAANLFRPFYSTKAEGQGVGLMITREILQLHHAQFRLFNDAITGMTRFEIWWE